MNAVVELGKDRTASLAILMVNPSTDRKSAKAVIDVKKHILTAEAAQKASSSHPAPDHPSDMITADQRPHESDLCHSPAKQQIPREAPGFCPSNQSKSIHTPDCRGGPKANVVAGVSLYSPPADETVSSMRQKQIHTSQPRIQIPSVQSEDSEVLTPDPQLIVDYIEFLKILPTKRNEVIGILEKNDITHPKILNSKRISDKRMSKWGLSNGLIAQLRDNVTKFEKHLALQ
ncbi:hypothetical protein PTTG_27702 [Puccinia triticina 1-1 BBBD Race 1]|uniref:Uncharacterized protein n=1 Tax=Puccinia triticina (isolate 1-1 / race 1 (BBBD)) TaxID=630390 RepID=A0A180GI15_PUCT1|nr:hypothetical protein PTTG_27702 [Puccinia triticina 1-1 BBBD Race 1]